MENGEHQQPDPQPFQLLDHARRLDCLLEAELTLLGEEIQGLASTHPSDRGGKLTYVRGIHARAFNVLRADIQIRDLRTHYLELGGLAREFDEQLGGV